MSRVYYPDYINEDYYKQTIDSNPNVTLDGFYDGPKDDAYNKSRKELLDGWKTTFLCDEWLDFFCSQCRKKQMDLDDKQILKYVCDYWEKEIPLGFLIIAIKKRRVKHTVIGNPAIMSVPIDKVILKDYVRNNYFEAEVTK